MAFLAESARTRASLEEAAGQLGVEVRDMTAAALSLARAPDGARALARAAADADALAIRHPLAPGRGQAFMRAVAEATGHPVVNLQSDEDHPIQTLADALTLQDAAGLDLTGVEVAVTWAWQRTPARPPSVPQGLLLLLPRLGVRIRLAHPPGFELNPETLDMARRLAAPGGGVTHFESLDEALTGADFVYPQGWAPASLLHRPEDAAALAAPFADWFVDSARLDRTSPAARVLRSLPAAEGEEVASATFEGERGLFFAQANHRLAVMRAVLLECIPAGGADL